MARSSPQGPQDAGGWREWLAANNAAIMLMVFLVFGFVLMGQGIADLS